VTTEDVIHRRTSLGLRGLDTPAVRFAVSAVLEYGAGFGRRPRGSTKQSLQAAE
jgi:hypothetical protein